MKKTLLLFGLVVGSFIYAQNVGIETDNPQYTLDVEGSVRLSEPGEFVEKSKPLGVNNDTKQVIALEVSEDGDPFHAKRYIFNYSRGTGITRYDLGINTNTHDVMLVGSSLVIIDGRTGKAKGKPNISAIGVSDQNRVDESGRFTVQNDKAYRQTLVPIVLQERGGCRGITDVMPDGRHYALQGSMSGGLIYKDVKNMHQSPSYSQLTATIESGAQNWYFSGGTEISTLVETGRAVWVVDVLIINKNWVDSRNIVEVNVGGDFKTITRVVRGTHPAVQ